MLKKPASGVLTSFRPSTYPRVRLGHSLAAVLLDELFEHPASGSSALDVDAIGGGTSVKHGMNIF
jgi:hypothetical protein